MNLVLKIEDPYSSTCMGLVSALSAEESVLYGGEPDAIANIPEGVDDERGVFVVAWIDDEAVGCGAMRPMDDSKIAEVKRMYVKPNARRLGISRQILAKLEAVARDYGYSALRLETGKLQPAAINLYETSDYKRIPCYGHYVDDPYSVCYEKRLGL